MHGITTYANASRGKRREQRRTTERCNPRRYRNVVALEVGERAEREVDEQRLNLDEVNVAVVPEQADIRGKEQQCNDPECRRSATDDPRNSDGRHAEIAEELGVERPEREVRIEGAWEVCKNRSDALLKDCEKEVARYVGPRGGNLREVVMQRAVLVRKCERSQAECGDDEADPERGKDSQEAVPDKPADGALRFRSCA